MMILQKEEDGSYRPAGENFLPNGMDNEKITRHGHVELQMIFCWIKSICWMHWRRIIRCTDGDGDGGSSSSRSER
jgi:hypothetical protein